MARTAFEDAIAELDNVAEDLGCCPLQGLQGLQDLQGLQGLHGLQGLQGLGLGGGGLG